MSFVRAAARAALASGAIVVFGVSCKPEHLTSPSRELDAAPALRASTSRGVKILTAPDTLELGQTIQLEAQNSVSSKLRTASSVTWTSLDSSVVSVTSLGEATAIGGGKGRVVAQSGNTADTASMYVAVSVTSVVASPDNGTVTVGQTSQLTAVAKDPLGQPVSGAPIAWSTTNASVATVNATGVVSGVAVGTAGVVASSGGFSDTVSVSVTAVAVASVAVAPTSVSLAAGATSQLTATAKDASGTTLTGRLVTWKSSNAQVVTVDATGKLSGVAQGTATVTATIDGKSASSAVTVTAAAVTSVTASVNATALTVGQTTQASATAKDASGAVISGRTVTWSTSDAKIATVSSTGLVTAVAAGSATITATVDGVKGSVGVTVTNVVIASVSVSINSSSVAVGQTTQATATALDASGKPVTGRTVTWSSSNNSIASVSSTGVVTGVAGGSASISATVDGKTGQANITVTIPTTSTPSTPAPTGTLATLPELPRLVVDARAVPAPTGQSIRVAAGGDLQAAINAAQPGDEIVLAAGASYAGNFILPAKPSGSAWITIRSDAPLPAPGTRVRPSDAASFAKILTNSNAPAILGDMGSNHWRFMGVELGAVSSVTMVNALVQIGSDVYTNPSTQLAHDFVFDRVYAHGNGALDLRRCLQLYAAAVAVVDSYLGECHSNQTDSQAILGNNSPGPFTIINNTLEGGHENIMFGGGDPQSASFVPSDITIKGNHIIKPLSWQGKWTAKNLLELKLGKRVLIEGNVFENSWASAQAGFAIVMWSVNQDGRATYSETSDVTFQYNIVRNANNAFQLSDGSYWSTYVPMQRVAIRNNIVTGIGRNSQMGAGGGKAFQIGGNIRDLTISHNTGDAGAQWLYFIDNPGIALDRLTILDNIGFYVGYDAMHSDYGSGTTVWNTGSANGGTFLGNVLAGAPVYGTVTWPTNNSYPVGGAADATAAVGFVNPTGGDYTLSSSSPFRGAATDRTDPGANVAEVRNRTSASIQAY